MIDYRELLKKYMRHIKEEEGITFLNSLNTGPNNSWSDDVLFTPQEVEELRKVEKEIDDGHI